MAAACQSSCRTAHPRSRGENSEKTAGGAGNRGSSPLTRGKQRSDSPDVSHARLIPAHAGKTTASAPSQATSTAHPRSRGENIGTAWINIVPSGSSPLTRGKPVTTLPGAVGLRLIPAHAGKTVPVDHESGRVGGSSPLTRGKQGHPLRPVGVHGLIPAHAGKTVRVQDRYVQVRAHPRSRGENWSTPKLAVGQSGSSPLTRGKLQASADDAAD